MRLITWLAFASLLAPASVAAQVDTAFKNVEYLTGSSMMSRKTKGILVVAATEVRLVDKKGAPVLVIPVANIVDLGDVHSSSAADNAKASLLRKSGLGFLSGGGSKQKLVISTRTASGLEEAIEFKINDRAVMSQIRARIKTEMNIVKMAQRRASGDTSPETGPASDVPATPPTSVPYILVANPFASAASDSVAAVTVGNAARIEVQEIMGAGAQVVTREQMNAALEMYGYSADAIIDSSLAMMLAKTVKASIMVIAGMTKRDDGLYTVAARLGPVGGEVSPPVIVVQGAGESLADFGRRLADALKGK